MSDNSAPAAARTFATIPLRTTIHRDGGRVEALSLREPNGPALMDISLYDLMRMQTGEIIKLLPRIAEPPITAAEAMMLAGHDLFSIGQEISAFLLLSESG